LGLESDEQILRQFYQPIALVPEGKGEFTLKVPPTVLTQERTRDRSSRGTRPAYPIFAGIVLDKEAIDALGRGDTLDAAVRIEDLERALAIGDVVDLETGEVLLEANDPVPHDV
jgi:hypothetical protein